jgi:hypothetical protein
MCPMPRRPTSLTLEEWVSRGFRPHVNVKFDDRVRWPDYADGVERYFEGALLDAWNEIRRAHPGTSFRRLFPSLEETDLERMRRQAMTFTSGYEAPRLQNCFAVECPPDAPPTEFAQQLARLPQVECAYVEGPPAPPPGVTPGDEPLSGYQEYLGDAPKGISVTAAWRHPGGDGAGMRLADIEQGWLLKHPDLPGLPPIRVMPPGFGVNYWDRAHGTNVLGVVLAADNEMGCIGIVPGVQGYAVSEWWRTPGRPGLGQLTWPLTALWFSRPAAIAYATWLLAPGDVMLLETQVEVLDPQPDGTSDPHEYPAEFHEINHLLIKLAVNKGIVVVEAAGNGGEDLDAPLFGRAYERGARDTGAIMVAAGEWTEDSQPAGFEPASFTNYGHRVDCFSWGLNVVTLGSPAEEGETEAEVDLGLGYVGDFGGTSSAAAIVAGCATAVQGVARWQTGRPLPPLEVRRLLSDPTHNTRTHADSAVAPPGSVDLIGVQPRLDWIIAHIFR